MSSKPALSGFDTGKFLPVTPSRPTAPKVSLTAWQRWEMASFAQALQPNQAEAAAPEPVLEPFEPVLLIDEAELTRLRLQAQETGKTEGYEQGYARGQTEGHAAGLAAVQAQAEQLQALALTLPAALRMAESSVADELLALALDIARQVLGQALTADPQALLPLVHELLQAEPALTGAPQLLLHPDDAALVKEHLADELKSAGWRIRVDAHITRGGCRALASSGERDASLETRWERVTATLARNAPAATPIAP
jgi:flagellar assembly protein FliH